MKNIVILIGLLVSFQAVNAQRKPKIKGNRKVVEVQQELPPFNSIELVDDLDIILQKSSREGYSLEADDNLIDILKFKVQDSTLYISSFYKITGKKKLDITIQFVDLKKLTLQDGRIDMQDIITTDELYVTTFGASRLELNASAPYIQINMEGMSSGDYNLASDSLNITLKDRVDASIYSVGESSAIKMYKNASAKLEGKVDIFYADLYENSNLKAEKLEAETVKATLQESPSASVYALDNFELSSRGSSKTYLYGEAKIVILEFLDTSQLNKEK